MLRTLTIEEYGLIERAQIEFAPGATIFTGETGSGKTMVLGALEFALGQRASPDAVRRGAPRVCVTLVFEPGAALRERLAGDGFSLDADEDAVLVREMTAAGKSTARLCGRPVTASYVREIAAALVDAVGQHEAQRLLAPNYHGELLDRFAGDEAAAAKKVVRAASERVCELRAGLAELERDDRDAQERAAFARFASDEIERAQLQVGEDERLSERRRYLDNVERISESLRTAHDALSAEDASAAQSLGQAASALHAVASIGNELEEMARDASLLQSETADLAARIARAFETLEFDAGELERINGRLALLDTLKRKYGGEIAAVLDRLEQYRQTAQRYENRDAERAKAQEALRLAVAELARAAGTLTRLRRNAARALERAAAQEFAELALASARFTVHLGALAEIEADGAERIEFLFAANRGEPERPLTRVASGGELSRLLLALVVVLAAAREPAALVFDEIDAGIGGTTATAVGARLGRLASAGQVLCVTHLAQIATWADRHYLLEKREAGDHTTIEVRPLSGLPQRTAELARMLSGEPHEAAVVHARVLLEGTTKRRRKASHSVAPTL